MSRKVIAQIGVCQVEVCPCGTTHLSIGPVTIALFPDALADIAKATTQALRRLAAPVAEPAPTSPGEPLPPNDATSAEDSAHTCTANRHTN